MNWEAIRNAVAARLQTIDDERLDGYTVYTTTPPAVAANDSVIVVPGDPWIEPYAHGLLSAGIAVRVRTRRDTPQGAQNALAVLASPTGGIVDTLIADQTIGGTAQSLRFVDARNYEENVEQGSVQVDLYFSATVAA